jgi:hypothetical protein
VSGETKVVLPRPFVEFVRMKNVEVAPLRLLKVQ